MTNFQPGMQAYPEQDSFFVGSQFVPPPILTRQQQLEDRYPHLEEEEEPFRKLAWTQGFWVQTP